MITNKERKVQKVEKLREVFAEGGTVFVTHYHGMKVSELQELRSKIKEGGASFFVEKNTLLKRGMTDTPFEKLSDKLTGPVAVTIAKDPVTAAKVLVNFAKNSKLDLVGAQVEETLMDPKGVEALSKVPPLNELKAMIISLIQTPARGIASTLNASVSSIPRVLCAYSKSSIK